MANKFLDLQGLGRVASMFRSSLNGNLKLIKELYHTEIGNDFSAYVYDKYWDSYFAWKREENKCYYSAGIDGKWVEVNQISVDTDVDFLNTTLAVSYDGRLLVASDNKTTGACLTPDVFFFKKCDFQIIPKSILYGNNRFVIVSENGTVSISTDDGKTWSTNNNLIAAGCTSIFGFICKASYGDFYAISETGTYKSNDGVSWNKVCENPTTVASDIPIISNGLSVYAIFDKKEIYELSYSESWSHICALPELETGYKTFLYNKTSNSFIALGDDVGSLVWSNYIYEWSKSDVIDEEILSHKILQMIYSSGRFVGLLDNSDISVTSIDGEQWETVKSSHIVDQFNSLDVTISVADAIKKKWGENIAISGSYANAEGGGTKAIGSYSHAEGNYTKAIGENSHAEGYNTKATADNSHAEGASTTASGSYSHAEGWNTIASGSDSHAEGSSAIASGYTTHAEGTNTKATADSSHAEGRTTTASGISSHAEGNGATASGPASHAGGYGSIASGFGSFSHGWYFSSQEGEETVYTEASGDSAFALGMSVRAIAQASFAEGQLTTASAKGAHAEGTLTIASGHSSHSGGNSAIASGNYSFAHGQPITPEVAEAVPINTEASGVASFAIGVGVKAIGEGSSANGYSTVAEGAYSHAEGHQTKASGTGSHAEGDRTDASGDYSHVEGQLATASGKCSHAEGFSATASGNYSHAEGYNAKASGYYSHAGGNATLASAYGQTAIGYYNREYAASSASAKNTDAIFIVGNGSSASARSNAFRVGNAGTFGATYYSSGADYAEFFEWADGNSNGEDRVGRFVTLEGDKIRLATFEDEFILGVVSGNPSIVGDSHDDQWKSMYLYDMFGRPVYETVIIPEEVLEDGTVIESYEEVRHKLNPDFDNTKTYISRSDRSEWSPVGMMGKLVVEDDGSCAPNGYCLPYENGIAVKSDTSTKYRVMKRIDETHIQILVI